jgi:ABC-type Zn uptake system ZnuABC Zn-binding protein ZnuA
MTRLLVAVAVGVATGVLLAACAPAASDDGRPQVVATTTEVGQVAGELGGDAIQLATLLPPGAEAHDFELTTDDARAIERANVILKSGAGLESWLDRALQTIGGEDRVRDMSVGVPLRTVEEEGRQETDPHYWLSAPNAVLMVNNVRDALIEVAPDSAADIRARAEAYVARLEEADTTVRDLMADIPEDQRGIVTNHDALGYFIEEYGLRFVGSVFPAIDVSGEPDPSQLAALEDTIRQEGVTAIFSESAVNPRLAGAIAQDTGAQVVEEPLYTDSLGPPGSDADTLDGMLLHDARVIHDALTADSAVKAGPAIYAASD